MNENGICRLVFVFKFLKLLNMIIGKILVLTIMIIEHNLGDLVMEAELVNVCDHILQYERQRSV